MLDETMHASVRWSDLLLCSLIRYLASNKVSPDDVIVLEIGVNDLLVRYFVRSMHLFAEPESSSNVNLEPLQHCCCLLTVRPSHLACFSL